MIDSAWVAESTQEDRSIDRDAYYLNDPKQEYYKISKNGGYYGYFWWGRRLDDGNYDFYASAHLTQRIHISPQADLIIVRNGERDPPDEWEVPMSQFISAMGKSAKKAEAEL